MADFKSEDLDYTVCGCSMCGLGVYDGVIVYALRDGTKINRFRGEDSYREQWIDDFIANALTVHEPYSPFRRR